MTTQAEASKYVREYGGLDAKAADDLVGAVLEAVQAEALDQIAAPTPTPSNMTDARALRLRYICEKAGRMASRREVEMIFRVPPTNADAIIRRLQALYPQTVDAYLQALVTGGVVDSILGNTEEWDIYFAEPAAWEYARQLLTRQHLIKDVRFNRAAQTMRVRRKITDAAGNETDPLNLLGLTAPKPKPVV